LQRQVITPGCPYSEGYLEKLENVYKIETKIVCLSVCQSQVGHFLGKNPENGNFMTFSLLK
jgi:hypothetical protein